MPPIFTKALFDFVLPAILSITHEVMNRRKSADKANERN